MRQDMSSNYLTCLGREIHYTEWGAENPDVLIMWHGLARTGRDFDIAAAHFAKRFRVICPDTIGRGLSQWSPDPRREYSLDFYVGLAAALIDALGAATVRWVGTSMGGAIGVKAAAGPLKGRVSHLVLNDIGPKIADAAVERILNYVGTPPAFDTVGELEAFLRTVYRPYGKLADREWRAMAETSLRRMDNGQVTVHYDPRIVDQFRHHPGDYDLWWDYDTVTVPTLVLRGADSDLLLPDVAAEMTRCGPRARLVEIAGCGHAPALNVAEQLEILESFLL